MVWPAELLLSAKLKPTINSTACGMSDVRRVGSGRDDVEVVSFLHIAAGGYREGCAGRGGSELCREKACRSGARFPRK